MHRGTKCDPITWSVNLGALDQPENTEIEHIEDLGRDWPLGRLKYSVSDGII